MRSSIGKESSLPILSTILLKTQDGVLSFSATNLEIGVYCVIRGKIEKEGSIAIDARTFTDYIGLLPKEKVEIEVGDDYVVSVRCQNYSTKIRGVNPEDFPIIPSLEKSSAIHIPVQELKDALASTLFAVVPNESRPELSGLLFHLSATKQLLTLVGTDAYRLGEKHVKVKSELSSDLDVILPLRTLQELIRIIQHGLGGTLELYVTDNQVLFVCEGTELYSKRIQGQYPDYTQIIPTNFVTTISLDRQELIQAIKTGSVFSKAGLQDIQLSFQAQDEKRGKLTVFTSNSTIGENKVSLDVQMEGNNVEVVLNYKYLLDGLQTIQDERVFVYIVDGESPCVIKPEKAENYRYLVMPIRQ